MYIPVLLFGDTVASILLILIYGLLGFILLILICGLLGFALLMWLGRTGTIYEAGDSIVGRIRGRQQSRRWPWPTRRRPW